jgi:hypothetical protein
VTSAWVNQLVAVEAGQNLLDVNAIINQFEEQTMNSPGTNLAGF